MKRLDRLQSKLLRKYKAAAGFTDFAFEARTKSQAQLAVNKACSLEAEVIFAVAKIGALDEKTALEQRLQQRDLEKYAKSPAEEKSVRQGLKDMNAALVAYAELTERPEEYIKQAAGYTDRNRDTKLDVPKDGMRYALSSQMTRLQNRLSLQLTEEEKVLLTARIALLHSLQKEYSDLQKTVMHGE